MRSASLSRARAAGSSRRWRSGLRSRSWPSRSPSRPRGRGQRAQGDRDRVRGAGPVLAPGAGAAPRGLRLGAWAVGEDGSTRRLGDYREATCSPFGRFVGAAGRTSSPRSSRTAISGGSSPAGRPSAAVGRHGNRHEDRLPLGRPHPRGRGRLDRRPGAHAGRGGRGFPARSACSPWRVRAASRSSTPSGDKPGGRRVAADSLVWSADGTRLLALRGGRYTVLSPAGEVRRRARPQMPPSLRAAMPLPSCAARRRAASSPSAVACASRGRAPSATRPGRPTAAGSLFPGPTPTSSSSSAPGPRRIEAAANVSAQFERASSPRVAGWCPAGQP